PGANLAVIVLSDEDDCSALGPALFDANRSDLGPLNSFRCFRFGVQCDQDTSTIGAKSGCLPAAKSTLFDDIGTFRSFLLSLKNNDERMVMFGAVVGDPAAVAVEQRDIGAGPQLALAHSCAFSTASGTA